jgi:hypothetical protein
MKTLGCELGILIAFERQFDRHGGTAPSINTRKYSVLQRSNEMIKLLKPKIKDFTVPQLEALAKNCLDDSAHHWAALSLVYQILRKESANETALHILIFAMDKIATTEVTVAYLEHALSVLPPGQAYEVNMVKWLECLTELGLTSVAETATGDFKLAPDYEGVRNLLSPVMTYPCGSLDIFAAVQNIVGVRLGFLQHKYLALPVGSHKVSFEDLHLYLLEDAFKPTERYLQFLRANTLGGLD